MNNTIGQLRRLLQDTEGLSRTVQGVRPEMFASLVGAIPEIARQKNLGPLDARMKRRGADYNLLVEGTSMILPADCFAGIREMYARRVYLASDLVSLPTSGWVVDCGANQGLFSILAAKAGCKVVSVDPQSGFTNRRRELMRMNAIDDAAIKHVECFVGPTKGEFADDSQWNSASHASSVRPTSKTMDELFEEFGIDEVALLKLDIEGAEYDLFGDPKWLSRVSQITMEVHGAFGEVAFLLKALDDAGFITELRDPDLKVSRHITDGYLYARRGA